MTLEDRNRLIAIGAIAVAAAALAWIAFGKMGNNLIYYVKPSELISKGASAYGTSRLGGVVVPGTVNWSSEHTSLTFELSDTHQPGSPRVKVACNETPPQMFREGVNVVLEGNYGPDQVFKTTRLMVNHSNEYRATDGGRPEYKELAETK